MLVQPLHSAVGQDGAAQRQGALVQHHVGVVHRIVVREASAHHGVKAGHQPGHVAEILGPLHRRRDADILIAQDLADKGHKHSVMGENYLQEQTAPMKFEEGLRFNAKRVILIIVFLATIVLSVVGSLLWSWGLPEIAAIYFPVTILGVIIFRLNPSEACVEFGKGMAGTIAPTMVIGFSRAVSVLLTEGNITDTIIHAVSGVLEGKSPVITLLIIFLFVTGFNFFVASGSGKAVVMMPILQPLGQVLGINQQVLVLAYQYGDGFTNTFWPTAALLQLSLCGMDYGRWFKFAWKVYACLIASGFILIVIANAIGYGPF